MKSCIVRPSLFQALGRESKRHAKSWRGEKEEKEGRESLVSPVSSRFIFVFALSQFSGPNYLGAWNRLCSQFAHERKRISGHRLSPPERSDDRKYVFVRRLRETVILLHVRLQIFLFSARFAGLLKAGVRLRASFMNELIH